jgi:hypothetical protein
MYYLLLYLGVNYIDSGASHREGRFVVDGQSFHKVLLGSQVFFFFPGVLGAEVDNGRGVSWRCCFAALLYLAAKPAHVGVDVDGLA